MRYIIKGHIILKMDPEFSLENIEKIDKDFKDKVLQIFPNADLFQTDYCDGIKYTLVYVCDDINYISMLNTFNSFAKSVRSGHIIIEDNYYNHLCGQLIFKNNTWEVCGRGDR